MFLSLQQYIRTKGENAVRKQTIWRYVQSTEQIKHVKEYLEEGSVANRGVFDGDWKKQFFGILAQTVVCSFLGLPAPVNQKGFDGGTDVMWRNKRYDVKCRLGGTDFKPAIYCHNVPEKQTAYDNDGYIFVHYNDTNGYFEICGYIDKQHFMNLANYRPKGSKIKRTNGSYLEVHESMYDIKNDHLEQFDANDSYDGDGRAFIRG